MKKIIGLFTLIALFAFGSMQEASAQLTFYNGTNCKVQIYAGYDDQPNPCPSPSNNCYTGLITLLPGFTTVPGPACYFPWSGTAYFWGFKFGFGPITTSVELCGNQTSNVVDCQGFPRTLQIFNPNFAAVY